MIAVSTQAARRRIDVTAMAPRTPRPTEMIVAITAYLSEAVIERWQAETGV